jgi:hypothetical protein
LQVAAWFVAYFPADADCHGGETMPIYRLLQNEAFDPETIDMLARSFEAALDEMGIADRSSPYALIVAERVIEFAKWGERDATRLRRRLLESMQTRSDDMRS